MSGESDTTRFYAICRKSVAFSPTGAAPASTGFTAALQISSMKVKFAIIRARSHGRVETGSLEVAGRLLRVSSRAYLGRGSSSYHSSIANRFPYPTVWRGFIRWWWWRWWWWHRILMTWLLVHFSIFFIPVNSFHFTKLFVLPSATKCSQYQSINIILLEQVP